MQFIKVGFPALLLIVFGFVSTVPAAAFPTNPIATPKPSPVTTPTPPPSAPPPELTPPAIEPEQPDDIGEGPPPPPDGPIENLPGPGDPAPHAPIPDVPEPVPAGAAADCKVVSDTCGDILNDLSSFKHNTKFEPIHITDKTAPLNETFSCQKLANNGVALLDITVKNIHQQFMDGAKLMNVFTVVKSAVVRSCTHNLYWAHSSEVIATELAGPTPPSFSRKGYLKSPAYKFSRNIYKLDTSVPAGAPQIPVKSIANGYIIDVKPVVKIDPDGWDYTAEIYSTGSLSETRENDESINDTWEGRVSLAIMLTGTICPEGTSGKWDNTSMLRDNDGGRLDITKFERITGFEPMRCPDGKDALTQAMLSLEDIIGGESLNTRRSTVEHDTTSEELWGYHGTMTPPWTERSTYSLTINGVATPLMLDTAQVLQLLRADDKHVPPIPFAPKAKDDKYLRFPIRAPMS